MTSRSLSLSLSAAAIAALVVPTPSGLHATGDWNSINLLEDHQYAALSSPEFWFELEMKELARDFAVPEKHSEKEIADVEFDGYDEAVKAGKIKVPDAAAYRKSLEEKRAAINKASGSVIEPDPNADPPEAKPEAKPAAPADTGPMPTDEFGLYLRGAAAYVAQDYPAATAAWKALLALPEAERRYRTVWAEYMLGMAAVASKTLDDAPAHFQKTRELAAGGFPDPLGLAAASYGWEAYAHKETDLEKAMTLYLKQLAAGDVRAVVSLRHVMPTESFEAPAADDAAKDKPADAAADPLAKLAQSPVVQRVITRWFLAMASDLNNRYASANNGDSGPARWLGALEKSQPKASEADRLAWLAYRQGAYPQAARWLKLVPADTRLSLWLTAKLALRAGDTAKAAKAMEQVAALPAPTDEKLVVSQNGGSIPLPTPTVRAEQAAILLSRGQYAEALTGFSTAGYWNDAAYVAERVMTLDELKQYVDAHFPKPADDEIGTLDRDALKPVVEIPAGEPTPEQLRQEAKEKAKEKAGPDAKEDATEDEDDVADGSEDILARLLALGEISPDHPAARDAMAWRLRFLLARRMVRDDREAEARPYFPRDLQPALDAYVAVLQKANDKKTPPREKAVAWWKAAWIARHAGMELMGTEVAPDNSFEGGAFSSHSIAKERRTGLEDVTAEDVDDKPGAPKKLKFGLPPSADEKKRLAKHVLGHENRYHYRWVAAALARKAAALLPDGSEEKADVLNQAGSWLFNRDVKGEEAFFFEIKKTCPNTTIGKSVLESKHTVEDTAGPWSSAEPK